MKNVKMGFIKVIIVMVLIVMAFACSDIKQNPSAKAVAVPDNQENRLIEAKRVIEVLPPKQLLQGLAHRIEPSIPEKDRKMFMEVMNSKNVEESTNKIVLDALVKDFTVGELRAMVSFYGSADGHSAYTKFPNYMADIMPKIHQEVKIAYAEAQKHESPPSQEKPKNQEQGQSSGKKEANPVKNKK
jgi:hypothetical protein